MSVDELEVVGLARMTDDEIRVFLTNQRVGVLGLPAADGPYMLPLSFGFDGDSRVYFTYVLGADSRKERLTDRTDTARFLVFDAPSTFTWESVLLTGRIEAVPETEWDDLDDVLSGAWRPDLFAAAELTRGVKVYRFEITDQVGLKHTGLPPGLEPDARVDEE